MRSCSRWTKPFLKQPGDPALPAQRACGGSSFGRLHALADLGDEAAVAAEGFAIFSCPPACLAPPAVAGFLSTQTPRDAFALFTSSFLHSFHGRGICLLVGGAQQR